MLRFPRYSRSSTRHGQPTDFVSWEGNSYFVKIELKDTVTAEGGLHTP